MEHESMMHKQLMVTIMELNVGEFEEKWIT